MKNPCFLTLKQAQQVLADIGIELNDRQIKRAADKDATGRRKLPFFVDPIDKKLRIEKGTILAIYNECQVEAAKNSHVKPGNLKKLFDDKS
ncbi:hypothetical protein [Marinobacterium sedimentorum]|uniref:hypothetical protein n=1 Tax=Marinobacterium sedimentorum TaxID=2927804 RepID=UPI0020C67526|nr:hypothetical protein [Marinobacterium sedimentorum]MCP8685968.1 hypothetical protein [Marinobacterium sedimentorum]